MTRRSSDEMSSLASSVFRMKGKTGATLPGLQPNRRYVLASDYNSLLGTAKALAGSVLSQDETPLRRIARTFTDFARAAKPRRR